MNEHARATGSGVSSAVRSHIWLLAVLLAVITVRSLPVTGEEPPSSATRAREAITSPLSLLEPLPEEVPAPDPDEAHARVFFCNPFPSAAACGECHPKHLREWSISQHAYAQMSPVFNAMHGRLLQLSNGTLGDFCIRCHSPVGMALGEPIFMANIDRHPVSREGVTCITCHRVNQAFGKVSGRRTLVQGDMTAPIYGPRGDNRELAAAVAANQLAVDPRQPGQQVHGTLVKFFQLPNSGFCATCHEVTVPNGLRLEEVFGEWKTSPANKQGISCQDCHAGKEPGRILARRDDPDFEWKNFDFGSAAIIKGERNDYHSAPRKLTNHMFVGPDHSVLPAALFPFNPAAIREEHDCYAPFGQPGLATIREWLTFNTEAGWGTAEFEQNVPNGYQFPSRWRSANTRYAARKIINENLELLWEMRQHQLTLLRNGYQLGEIKIDKADHSGIRFQVQVKNGTDGHNVPTGFDAERVVWLYVVVFDAAGNVIHQPGDLDPHGDVRGLHSEFVANRELPLDRQLFSLKSRFISHHVRGPERELPLALPSAGSVLPFVRPERRSSKLLGRFHASRKHKQGIEPYGHRWAKYSINKSQFTGQGPYHAVIQLKAGMTTIALINEIKGIGFEYNLTFPEIASRIVAGHQVLWERHVILDIKTTRAY